MVIWLIGLSNSGKTTIGKKLCNSLKATNNSVVHVDGDIIRELFQKAGVNSDYSLNGRRENAERIISICKWLDKQGIDVVCSILAIFPDLLKKNKFLFKDYKEIYLKVPIEILMQRDKKNLYAPALLGKIKNVVGVDINFPEPESPDLIFDNSKYRTDFENIAKEILDKLDR